MPNSLKSKDKVSFYEIERISRQVGLEVCGHSLAQAKPQEASRLRLWQEQGFAAGMAYMQRDPDLLSNPLRLLPEAKTILSFSVAYDTRPAPPFLKGHGRVARYAWGKDYHLVLPERLNKFISIAKDQFGEFKFRVFTDAVPLLERAFAASAGLGFIGKNTLLIRPRLGSFTLIAEILCDLEIEQALKNNHNSSCGSCRSCLDSCPTQAFKSEYVLDAGKCISYLSIEKKGALSLRERSMIGEWVFGCDVCQEVCPFNHSTLKQGKSPSLEDFSADFGVGPLLNLKEALGISTQQEFKKRFENTPLLRAKREGLLRNAICVAVNTDCFDLRAELKVLAKEDPSPLVRQFSYWGFAELGKKESGILGHSDRYYIEQGLKDPSMDVSVEVQSILN